MRALREVMSRLVRASILVVLLALVVGCGSVPQPAGHTVGRITYSVNGGIAGWQRTLTVEPDGTAVVQVVRGPRPGTSQHQVEATVLQRLRDLVRDPAFAALQKEYLPSPGGADMQDYVVSVEVDGRTITTMTRDGAEPPRILREVLAILNQILAAGPTR